MARYDFRSLSSQDFEDLVRDLLQAEWGVRLEAFASGRDQGIDLRYTPLDGGKCIVQCKHYALSGFPKLLHNLRTKECPKVELLRPDRYIVATSVALSPGNKDALVGVMAPFIKVPADVIGADDIDSLLSRHPDVERAHFKLWLTSTDVIERVLHNAEAAQTDFEVQRIRRKLPLFVQSDAFPRVMRLLDDSQVAIISGAPGIGKTTLAEMALYTYLERGYEPVVIQADVTEGKKFFRQDAKRIFYFDDFLGQFFLGDRSEYFGRNQDASILAFVDMVRSSKHSRFILTTREHLLQSARLLSEQLSRSLEIDRRCILHLRDYSYAQKARILYNHLYFSDLPQDYKDIVLADDFFLQIIQHEHFNPRLIEWLSTSLRRRDVAPTAYRRYISKLLDAPHDIWNHAFRHQLSSAARDILLSFYTLGEATAVVELEPPFRELHQCRAVKYNWRINPGDFHDGLRELDGAFLSYSAGSARYLNPSIREFIASIISSDTQTIADLISSATDFRQIVNIWRLADARPDSDLATFLFGNTQLLFVALRRTTRCAGGDRTGAPRPVRSFAIESAERHRIDFLLEAADRLQSSELLSLAQEGVERVLGRSRSVVADFEMTARLIIKAQRYKWSLEHGGAALCSQLLDDVLKDGRYALAQDWVELMSLPAKVSWWTVENGQKLRKQFNRYLRDGLGEERHNCTGLDEMDALLDSLRTLEQLTGIDLGEAIDELSEELDEIRSEETEEARDRRVLAVDRPMRRGALSELLKREHIVTDQDVRQMFDMLRED